MFNYIKTFHGLILAFFLLISLVGCGYKASPEYKMDVSNLALENK